jgi:hypothetical protein
MGEAHPRNTSIVGKRPEDAGAAELHAWMSALAQQLKGSTRRDGVNFDEQVVTD